MSHRVEKSQPFFYWLSRYPYFIGSFKNQGEKIIFHLLRVFLPKKLQKYHNLALYSMFSKLSHATQKISMRCILIRIFFLKLLSQRWKYANKIIFADFYKNVFSVQFRANTSLCGLPIIMPFLKKVCSLKVTEHL